MLLSRNFSVVSLCSELRGKCSPDCPGGGMLWHFRPTSRRARWKLSILLTAFIPSGRVLVGEGVLTKACRKKPKPRWRSVFDIFGPWSSQFIFPKIGSFSSSMICSSMETLWSTRKSTTSRWNIVIIELNSNLPIAALDSLGRGEIKILGGWGPVQEWLAHMHQVVLRYYL